MTHEWYKRKQKLPCSYGFRVLRAETYKIETGSWMPMLWVLESQPIVSPYTFCTYENAAFLASWMYEVWYQLRQPWLQSTMVDFPKCTLETAQIQPYFGLNQSCFWRGSWKCLVYKDWCHRSGDYIMENSPLGSSKQRIVYVPVSGQLPVSICLCIKNINMKNIDWNLARKGVLHDFVFARIQTANFSFNLRI